jgi:hypothetical protein
MVKRLSDFVQHVVFIPQEDAHPVCSPRLDILFARADCSASLQSRDDVQSVCPYLGLPVLQTGKASVRWLYMRQKTVLTQLTIPDDIVLVLANQRQQCPRISASGVKYRWDFECLQDQGQTREERRQRWEIGVFSKVRGDYVVFLIPAQSREQVVRTRPDRSYTIARDF